MKALTHVIIKSEAEAKRTRESILLCSSTRASGHVRVFAVFVRECVCVWESGRGEGEGLFFSFSSLTRLSVSLIDRYWAASAAGIRVQSNRCLPAVIGGDTPRQQAQKNQTKKNKTKKKSSRQTGRCQTIKPSSHQCRSSQQRPLVAPHFDRKGRCH